MTNVKQLITDKSVTVGDPFSNDADRLVGPTEGYLVGPAVDPHIYLRRIGTSVNVEGVQEGT